MGWSSGVVGYKVGEQFWTTEFGLQFRREVLEVGHYETQTRRVIDCRLFDGMYVGVWGGEVKVRVGLVVGSAKLTVRIRGRCQVLHSLEYH